MKTRSVGSIRKCPKTGHALALAMAALILCHARLTAATFTVTPQSVSNTYGGAITLAVSNVPTGDTVLVQKYIDLNTNGLVDAGDWLVQQFTLTDGQAGMVIGGVTNINVPGDLNPAPGVITAKMNFQGGDFAQNIGANYLLVLSSPAGHFLPITIPFNVTNFPYGQKIRGTAIISGTSTGVPGAVVLLFPPPRPGHNGPGGNPVAGTVSGGTGGYTLPLPPGTYMPVALSSNYLAGLGSAPLVTLGSGATVSTNLSLIAATATISGREVDAANTNVGLPGVLLPLQANNGMLGVGYTDTNGNFNIGVGPGQWKVGGDDSGLIVHGYVGFQNSTNVNAGTTNVIVPVSKATALVFGNVTDLQGNPLQGVDVSASDNNNLYQADGYTDSNGNYVVALLGLGNSNGWYINPSGEDPYANYLFSQTQGSLNISSNIAVQQNFAGAPGTNFITGNVEDGGTNLAGVGLYASVTVSNINLSSSADTDTNGNYSLRVFNGSWNVSVDCSGGSDSLDNLLGPGNYMCPNNQTVNISNSNGVANFSVTVATNFISGQLTDNTGSPISNVNIYANATVNGSFIEMGATTDTNGHYSIGVLNDSLWDVGVNTGGGNGGLPGNYIRPNDQTVGVTNDSVTVNFTAILATNFITGYVRNNNNNPLADVWVYASANINGNYYSTGSSTDTNGFYSMGVINSNLWYLGVSSGSLPAGYIAPDNQPVPVTNNNPAVDLIVLPATNYITGNVQAGGTNIAGVGVGANAMINGTNYSTYVDTDSNGNYSLNVANGSWSVGVNCNGGSDSLSTILGGTYACPNNVSTNISNDNGTVNFTVQPCAGITVHTTFLPDGEVGVYYDQFVQASGCEPPLNFSFMSGSIPPGLNLNPNGEISGIPTNPGPNMFTIGISDNGGHATNVTLSLTILAPFQITTASLPPANLGAYYSQQLQAAGGLPPYNWTWNSPPPTLPPGLILATNGMLSGYPASTGTFVFSVQASDSFSPQDSTNQTLSLTVNLLLFNIITSAGANGNISPSGTVTTNAGSSVTFTATPNPNYVVNQWLLDGSVVQTGGATYTLVNIQTNHALMVTFASAPVQETITASAGSGGAINPNGVFNVAFGSNQVFTATPNASDAVNQWLVDGTVVQTGGANYTLINIQTNHTVMVTFIAQYTINASAGANGAISPSGSITTNAGAGLTYTATPNANYTVNQWLLDGTVVQTGGTNYTLANIQANHTVTVTFIAQYTVTASAGANGGINPGGSVLVTSGASQSFTATPNANYTVNQWLLDGTVSQTGGTNYTLTNIRTNHTVQVTFAAIQYTINASAGANGAISPSGSITTNVGASLTYTATPNANYTVNQWLLDGTLAQTGGTNFALVNIQTNHTVQVTFASIQYTITASADTNGAISPNGTFSVNAGTNQTFTATPNSNYVVSQWLLDGATVQSNGTNYTLANIQTNHAVMVTFMTASLASVTNLSVSSAVGSVTLNWTAFADLSLKYEIFRAQSTNSMTNGGPLATISVTNTSAQYVDGAGQPGQTYYYAVAAINSNNVAGQLSAPQAGSNLVVWPQSTNLAPGGFLELCVTAQSTTPLSYQWLFNGLPLSDGGEVTGSQTACLTDGGVVSTGQFAVVVSSSLGSVTSPPAAVTLSAPVSVGFVAGTYNGLFYPYPPQEVTVANSGGFTLTLGKHGTFTGTLRYAAKALRFTGSFNSNTAYATANEPGRSGAALPMYLQLDTTPGQERITGAITNGLVVSGLEALLAARSVATPATPAIGTVNHFTLAIPGAPAGAAAPAGWSGLTVSVNGKNTLTVAGTLADGSKVSQSAPLLSDGDYPLFMPLYHGQGMLMGWLTFTANTAFADSVVWIKPPGQATFPNGFTLVTNAIGSSYVHAPGAPELVLTNGSGVLLLQSAGVSITNTIAILNNKATSATDETVIRFTPASGAFSGSFVPPGGTRVTVNGVVLQQQGAAVGAFLDNGQGGSVNIEQ